MATVSSQPSASVSVVVPSNGWWLRDPLDPTTDTRVQVAPGFEQGREERGGVFAPLGRSLKVGVFDVVSGADGAYTFVTKDQTEFLAVRALLVRQSVLLLQSPFGEQFYVRFYGRRSWTLDAPSGARTFNAPYFETAAP